MMHPSSLHLIWVKACPKRRNVTNLLLCSKQCRLVWSKCWQKRRLPMYKQNSYRLCFYTFRIYSSKVEAIERTSAIYGDAELGERESANVTLPSWVGRCVRSEIADQLFCSKSGGPPQPYLPPTPSAFEVPVECDVSPAAFILHHPSAPPDPTAHSSSSGSHPFFSGMFRHLHWVLPVVSFCWIWKTT